MGSSELVKYLANYQQDLGAGIFHLIICTFCLGLARSVSLVEGGVLLLGLALNRDPLGKDLA